MKRWIRRGIIRPLRRAIIVATAIMLALTPWSVLLGSHAVESNTSKPVRLTE